MGCGCSKSSCPINNSAVKQIETLGYYVVQGIDLDPDNLKQPMKAHCLKFSQNDSPNRYIKIYPTSDYEQTRTSLNVHSPIYTSVDSIPNGTACTWLRSERGFFACEAKSIIELGTTHLNILLRTGHQVGDKVFAAGECLTMVQEVYYNIASGCISREIDDKTKVVANAKDTFEEYSKSRSPTYVSHETPGLYTMIKSKPTLDLLHEYKRMGYNVRLFDNESNCEKLKMISSLNLQRQQNQTPAIPSTEPTKRELNRLLNVFRRAELVGGKKTRKHKCFRRQTGRCRRN